MSRLQKKCLIASAALHALLVVILIVGPAFFVEINKTPSLPVLEWVPAKGVDELLFGGGSPTAKPPPPAPRAAPPLPPATELPKPPAPKPKQIELPPTPKPEPKPEPPVAKSVPKPPDIPKPKVAKIKPVADKPEPVKPSPKKTEIKVNIDEMVTHNAEDRKQRERKDRERKEKELIKAREEYDREVSKQADMARESADRLDQELNRSLRNLRTGLSSGTAVEIPGPNGAAFANYGQIIKSIYDAAWLVREDFSNLRATVEVEITVERDGTVRTANITRRSGNSALDKSVREALNRVKTIGVPFPDGAKEVERKVKLKFDPQTKRLIG